MNQQGNNVRVEDEKQLKILDGHVENKPKICYKPMYTHIPRYMYGKIEAFELYDKLKEAEMKMDVMISKKRIDEQTKKEDIEEKKGIMRLFVYHTSQKSEIAESREVFDWRLRIEGLLIYEGKEKINEKKGKMSQYFNSITVDLLGDGKLLDEKSYIIEWRENAENREIIFDAIDVQRRSRESLQAKIALMPKQFNNQMLLSDKIASFIGKTEATLQEVAFFFWEYILHKNLMRKDEMLSKVPTLTSSDMLGKPSKNANHEDDFVINCDDLLKFLLSIDSFNLSDLYSILIPHFLPYDSIILDYNIDISKETTFGEMIIDIPVDIPLSHFLPSDTPIPTKDSLLQDLSCVDSRMRCLNEKISIAILALQDCYYKELFYKELSLDPAKFIDDFLHYQSQYSKILKVDEGYDEELVRRSSFFTEKYDLVKNKIDLLLKANRL